MSANPIGIIFFAGLFVLVGLGFVAMGRYLIRSANRLARVGVRVPGEVVGMRVNETSEVGRGSYYPVLRFATADGRDVETASDIGTDPAPAREGDRVTVVYDPAEPRTARIDSTLGRGTGIGWACVIGGAALAAFATYLGIAGLL
ncbi:MAG: DUF3592 domain-containing protein [Streptosporangiales bacterium]|nr:DUF3592 domain-containing protein [Streptosporangiales bacterium]